MRLAGLSSVVAHDELALAGAGEGGGRDPLGRGTGGGLLHHLVDLLQGETLGLGHEEVGVDEGARAKGAPDEENRGPEVALVRTGHVRGNNLHQS